MYSHLYGTPADAQESIKRHFQGLALIPAGRKASSAANRRCIRSSLFTYHDLCTETLIPPSVMPLLPGRLVFLPTLTYADGVLRAESVVCSYISSIFCLPRQVELALNATRRERACRPLFTNSVYSGSSACRPTTSGQKNGAPGNTTACTTARTPLIKVGVDFSTFAVSPHFCPSLFASKLTCFLHYDISAAGSHAMRRCSFFTYQRLSAHRLAVLRAHHRSLFFKGSGCAIQCLCKTSARKRSCSSAFQTI